MSVTLKTIAYSCVPQVTADVPHVYQEPVDAVCNIVKADFVLTVVFRIRPGFKTDGASIPRMFRWFLPSWSETDLLYNLGSTIHDALYIHKGFGLFSREECDDILRGIWRESGIGRFKAGVADKCVEWFAGGSKHFGNDGYNVGNLVELEF